MKKMIKDIMGFSAGSMMLGASSVAVAKSGGSAEGLSAMSSMMPAIGSITMLKHTTRMMPKPSKKKGIF